MVMPAAILGDDAAFVDQFNLGAQTVKFAADVFIQVRSGVFFVACWRLSQFAAVFLGESPCPCRRTDNRIIGHPGSGYKQRAKLDTNPSVAADRQGHLPDIGMDGSLAADGLGVRFPRFGIRSSRRATTIGHAIAQGRYRARQILPSSSISHSGCTCGYSLRHFCQGGIKAAGPCRARRLTQRKMGFSECRWCLRSGGYLLRRLAVMTKLSQGRD